MKLTFLLENDNGGGNGDNVPNEIDEGNFYTDDENDDDDNNDDDNNDGNVGMYRYYHSLNNNNNNNYNYNNYNLKNQVEKGHISLNCLIRLWFLFWNICISNL